MFTEEKLSIYFRILAFIIHYNNTNLLNIVINECKVTFKIFNIKS